MAHRVLITGAGGAIGRLACRVLTEAGHSVRGYDRVPGPEGIEHVFGGLQETWRLNEAAQGCDTLIHLAGTPDSSDFASDLVPNNVTGTWNALEAARLTGMRRVVLASTQRVVASKSRDEHITLADGYAAGDGYALTKVFVEEMGRHFHQRHQMSIVCGRFAWFTRNAKECARHREHRERDAHSADCWYLSHDDCGRFLLAAITAPDVGFAPVFVVSHNNGRNWLDSTGSGAVIGWKPIDSWPAGTPSAITGV
jgi:uronate dehydrogenase